MIDLATALTNHNVKAFLRCIMAGETNAFDDDAYRALYGWTPGSSRMFTSFDDHPRIACRSAWGWTSAAGAYQAMCAVPGKVTTDTWGDFLRTAGKHDFSPASQDLFAVWCVRRRGALQDVIDAKLEVAIKKCGREWASLPGSPYGQPTITPNYLKQIWVMFGGDRV